MEISVVVTEDFQMKSRDVELLVTPENDALRTGVRSITVLDGQALKVNLSSDS